jgi:hypothetical protein
MCPAGGRGHCCGIAEGAAEGHGAKQRRIFCIKSEATSHVRSMSSNCLLIMQNQFRPAGGARSGEG